MKYDLIDAGIEESKIYDTGIPVSIRFYKKYDKYEICKKLNLNPNKKTILFFGGGEFGLGKERTLRVLQSLINNINGYQIVAISGRNEKMKKKFEELVSVENKDFVRIYEFTNHVPEIMSISSFVVTKPGGLTSSESLASMLPMIIINPLPGHEEANASYLESSGSAIWLKNTDNIEETISNIMNSPNKLENMIVNKIHSGKNPVFLLNPTKKNAFKLIDLKPKRCIIISMEYVSVSKSTNGKD